MSTRWALLLFICSLLLGESRMDSGDDASGDSDDSDIADWLKRNKTSLITAALENIPKNDSDFHYMARDDHEVIHNLEREIRRKSRKRGPKSCMVSKRHTQIFILSITSYEMFFPESGTHIPFLNDQGNEYPKKNHKDSQSRFFSTTAHVNI